jgi:hypothetical protein
VTFYGDCAKMCEDFVPNSSNERTGCYITTHRFTLPFDQGIFYQKQHDCSPQPTRLAWLYPCDFSLFLRLKIKLRGHHLNTTEVIEAESHSVLNTLREHDFQDAFKEMAEGLGTVHSRGRELLRGWWWPTDPKVVSYQMATPAPEVMDCGDTVL